MKCSTYWEEALRSGYFAWGTRGTMHVKLWAAVRKMAQLEAVEEELKTEPSEIELSMDEKSVEMKRPESDNWIWQNLKWN